MNITERRGLNKRGLRLCILIMFFMLLSMIFAGSVYSQLRFSVELNLGYDIIIPQNEVFDGISDQSFSPNFAYFPIGASLSFTTTDIVSFALDVFYEFRYFERRSVTENLQERLRIRFHMLNVPLNMRVHFPLDLFLTVGFALNFVLGYDLSGTAFYYTNSPEDAPTEDDICIVDPKHYYKSLQYAFHNIDWRITAGLGWRYRFTKKYYLVIQIRGSFSIIDIDKSAYFKTNIHSIYLLGGFGINL